MREPSTVGNLGEVPVTVMMVVRNNERFLPEAIESVLRQTHRCFELLIVNDGSTDRSLAIAQEYAARDPRIRVVSQSWRGIAAARNTALKLSSNELIAILDGDDRMLPMRLERQLAFLAAHPEAAVVCTYAYLIDADGNRIGHSEHNVDVRKGIAAAQPSRFLEIVNPSTLVKRDAVLRAGGYCEELPCLSDRDLWGKLATSGAEIICQPQFLTEYRLHVGAVTKRLSGSGIGELIDFNIIRRLHGEPEIPYSCRDKWRRSRPVLQRLHSRINSLSTGAYKDATRYYAERRFFRCLLGLVTAALFRPVWVIRKLVRQLATPTSPETS